MERSVRRDELNSPNSTTPSSPASTAIDALKNSEPLQYIVKTRHSDFTEPAEDVEDEPEFRLFAAEPTQAQGGIQSVKIRSPTPGHRDPAFVQPDRPSSYYFSGPESTSVSDKVALSSADVRHIASIKWFGTDRPGRVLILPASATMQAALSQSTIWQQLIDPTDQSKHKRKGKKARIKLRIKLKAKLAIKEEAKLAQEAKDAAIREKKARKSREKKAKKRQRDKLKNIDAQPDSMDIDSSISSAEPAE